MVWKTGTMKDVAWRKTDFFAKNIFLATVSVQSTDAICFLLIVLFIDVLSLLIQWSKEWLCVVKTWLDNIGLKFLHFCIKENLIGSWVRVDLIQTLDKSKTVWRTLTQYDWKNIFIFQIYFDQLYCIFYYMRFTWHHNVCVSCPQILR